jgi:hypothetical protein
MVTGASAKLSPVKVTTIHGGVHTRVFNLPTLELPVRDPKLWSPETPHLYNVTLELKDKDGKVIDSIDTYFGLRTIARGKVGDEPFERILLNGKPIYLRGALDQSFNPKGIYTAPSDEFLKRDIELAREAGTNFLRIHIKPDEPRRLYWADKLGMLIMEDMPNNWRHSERSKKAWESTLREVIARDKNHPSIFAWVDFNETWGVAVPDPEGYKKNKDVQAWVGEMVDLTRQLDPTRLVEDMSPCNYDHISDTDLNSWHFYIDDHKEARRHIEEVVEKTFPGSNFNHVPGHEANGAPLINSEYGSVSAGGGDRDVSWGFRDLTTQLRRHPKIQGYIYTELSDIEWEHNGFYDYDRSKKEFGYDAFVPGMTVADLQGADFIGYDAPPAIVARPGEIIRVPLFVSHFSERTVAPTLKWWITGTDDYGKVDSSAPRQREVTWTPYGVTEQKPLAFRIKGPYVGAVAMVLQDESGTKIAANFVNVVVKPDAPQARVERLGDRKAALRFAPEDYASEDWSGPVGGTGKAYGQGTGEFVYRLKIPESVVKAKPVSVEFLLEASSKAGREKVDFADHKNPQDYPQTDAQKWPSTLTIGINGAPAVGTGLADDPADARGVLSHLNRVEHGSHGELIRLDVPLTEEVRADLAAGKPLEISIGTLDDAEQIGGLALFGENTGAFPFDPTVTITTEADLSADLGVKADAPVAVDTIAARKVALLRAGDSNQGKPTAWSYTTEDPGAGWLDADFDASSWKTGPAGFGSAQTPALQEHTGWHSNDIWLRVTVETAKPAEDDEMTLHLFHDEAVQIFVNGQLLLKADGYSTNYEDTALNPAQKALFRDGKNTIAVHCRQTSGGQGVDLGLTLLRSE